MMMMEETMNVTSLAGLHELVVCAAFAAGNMALITAMLGMVMTAITWMITFIRLITAAQAVRLLAVATRA
jgi:hypothetical protein